MEVDDIDHDIKQLEQRIKIEPDLDPEFRANLERQLEDLRKRIQRLRED